MDYKQTIELEENIELKNKADEIHSLFEKVIKLDVSKYIGNGRFLFWSDSHNKEYFSLIGNDIVFQCRYLHESYDVVCTPSEIFKHLKNKYRGVEHLESKVKYPRN